MEIELRAIRSQVEILDRPINHPSAFDETH